MSLVLEGSGWKALVLLEDPIALVQYTGSFQRGFAQQYCPYHGGSNGLRDDKGEADFTIQSRYPTSDAVEIWKCADPGHLGLRTSILTVHTIQHR
jgi:hypothetical protein